MQRFNYLSRRGWEILDSVQLQAVRVVYLYSLHCSETREARVADSDTIFHWEPVQLKDFTYSEDSHQHRTRG